MRLVKGAYWDYETVIATHRLRLQHVPRCLPTIYAESEADPVVVVVRVYLQSWPRSGRSENSGRIVGATGPTRKTSAKKDKGLNALAGRCVELAGITPDLDARVVGAAAGGLAGPGENLVLFRQRSTWRNGRRAGVI